MLGAVIGAQVFRDQPTLTGERVRLEPLTSAVQEDYLATLRDPEVRRLTGSHEAVDPDEVKWWLATRQDHDDRADWAAVRIADGAFLGEAVINMLDVDNASANYRILLGSPSFAIINGRTYSEGEFLRTARPGAAPATAAGLPPGARVRVYRINDGAVVLQNQEQLITVMLSRPELLQRNAEEQLLSEDRP